MIRRDAFRLKRKLVQMRGPKKAHVEAMRRILDQMDGRQRLALLRYYVDNQTEEQICAEFAVKPDWFRAAKMEARSRFAAAIKSPVQGSFGDVLTAA
jgi:DNA-directed RNA polymerase specialized sigma24 family protein